MDPFASTRHVSVLRLGATAREVLAASSGGRVLAVLTRAVYLESDDGELVWLTTAEVPMHGRGIGLRETLPRPGVESTYVVRGDGLALDGWPVLTWGKARVWRPPPVCVEARLSLGDLGQYLPGVRSFVDALPAPRGFGVMLGSIMGRPQEIAFDIEAAGNSLVLRQGLPAIAAIMAACRACDPGATLAAAEDLIGLGEGLTPSGDDFIGGMLFGVATLHEVYGLPARIPSDALRRFLATAQQRTNRISHTLLRDYAVGQGPEPLHRYLHALMAGEPVAAISRLASDVIRIGHSTGWDCLTGLWAALGMTTADADLSHADRSAGPLQAWPGDVEPWTSSRRSRRPTTKQRAA